MAALAAAALVAATGLLALGSDPAGAQAGGSVVINEFSARNSGGLVDAFGEQSDWIELHNTTGSSVNISGWSIVAGVDSWTFPPGTTVAANGYRVVFASGRSIAAPNGELHAGLKLNADGEYLALLNASGAIASGYTPAYPAQVRDQSYGLDDNDQPAYFLSPSPGLPNSTPLAGPIVFGTGHGLFTSSFSLTLDSTRPGVTIRYTTDGTEPTTGRGQIYNGPFTIGQTTVVRAVAYGNGNDPSFPETRTYLFLDDVIDQDASPPGFPTGRVNGQVFDWGMDPNVVSGNRAAIRASLEAIPTLSLVTDPDHLFDPATGIYSNPRSDGRDWERPASIELIDPAGADGFSVNAGVRIRGGASRSTDNPKHSFRLFFRSEYGDAKLDYPLFGSEGADTFDKIDLRTSQNFSWARFGHAENTLLRELWSRDTQAAMGHPHTRSSHYHLYLNGQYFGIFQTQERVSEEFAESYLGGDEEDYDVVKHDRDLGYRVRAAAGSSADWKALFSLVSDGQVSNSEFTTIAAQVDVENLADYFLLHYFSGDNDGAPSVFLNDYGRANNWYAVRNRTGGQWQFFDHDSEHSLCGGWPGNLDNTHDRWKLGSGNNGNWNADYMNPGWLHAALLSNERYVQVFRDSVQEHFVAGSGVFQVAAGRARMNERADSFAGGMLAHSARWGDAAVEPPRGVADWEWAVDEALDCIAQRRSVVGAQLAAYGLMPVLDPPFIAAPAGEISFGGSVSIANPNGSGTIWYTTDGTDPLGANLQPSGSANSASVATITDYTVLTARVERGGEWSAAAATTYSLANLPTDPAVVLNEYNGVAGNELLGNNATDPWFGRVTGNGGDWFELVVVEDGTDLRGWQLELIDGSASPPVVSDRLVLGSQSVLSDLAAGTIITVAENVADDVSLDPQAGDWWINLQANDAGEGNYITAASQQNFDTNHENWQLVIRDASGSLRALRTGEGEGSLTGVSSTEVGKLEATPTAQTTPASDYDDGTTSTFGQPNVWDGITQDLSTYRNAAPTIATVADQFSNAGAAISLLLTATDEGPVTWAADGLPAGLSLNASTGAITGTVTGPQTSSVTVTATDNDQLSGSISFLWEVNRRPALAAIEDRTSTRGFAASLALAATDPDGDTVTFSVAGLPPGLSLLDDLDLVSGFTAQAGAYDVVVTATDEHNLSVSRSFTWTVSGGTPTAVLDSRCVGGNGVLGLELVNPEFFAINFELSATGLPTRIVTVPADSTRESWFSGRPDGSYDVTVRAQNALLAAEELLVTCDEPVTVEASCLAGRGRVDVDLINHSPGVGAWEVQVGALERSVESVPWGSDRIVVTGRPEGFLEVNVSRNGVQRASEQVLIDCVQSPESVITSRCFAGAGRIDARIVNDTQASGAYELRVTGLRSRLATVEAQQSVRLSRTGRADGFYDVAVFRDGARIDNDRVLINCVTRPEVAVAVTCLNGDGRVDVVLSNDSAVVRNYSVTVGALSAQTFSLAPQANRTATRTGRPDADLTVSVERSGTLVHTEVVAVRCDTPAESAAVRVSCLAGAGRVDALLFNDLGDPALYRVRFASFAPRELTLSAGDSTRESITGRPDGPFQVIIERDGAVLVSNTVAISCA